MGCGSSVLRMLLGGFLRLRERTRKTAFAEESGFEAAERGFSSIEREKTQKRESVPAEFERAFIFCVEVRDLN